MNPGRANLPIGDYGTAFARGEVVGHSHASPLRARFTPPLN